MKENLVLLLASVLNAIRGGQWKKHIGDNGRLVFQLGIITILLYLGGSFSWTHVTIETVYIISAIAFIFTAQIGLHDYVYAIAHNRKSPDFRGHLPIPLFNPWWLWGVTGLSIRGVIQSLPFIFISPWFALMGVFDGIIYYGLYRIARWRNLESKADWAWSRFEYVSGAVKYGIGFCFLM